MSKDWTGYTLDDWRKFLSYVEPVEITEEQKEKGLVQGCWHWTGAISNTGYGTFTNPEGKTRGAHREVFKFCRGKIPLGHVLMHLCDNPQCVNPFHHTTGTPQENMVDMVNKGRGRNQHSQPSSKGGENNSQASFTEEQVRNIKLEYAAGKKPERIAKKYQRPLTTIKDICQGVTWQHIEVHARKRKMENEKSRDVKRTGRHSVRRKKGRRKR